MPPEWTLYHNPKCSKSRGAAEFLASKGVAFAVVEYLKNPPDEAALRTLLAQLKLSAGDLVRTKEPCFAELNLDLTNEGAVLQALARYPQLLERPIVVRGNRAVIARPTENILKLFGP